MPGAGPVTPGTGSGKILATEVGDVDIAVSRDQAGSFDPALVPKGPRRAGGLDEMIISCMRAG